VDLSWLLIILDKAYNTCHWSIQQLAEIAGKLIWYAEDVELATATGDAGFSHWLSDVMKHGRTAQLTFYYLSTANSLEDFS